MNRFPGESLHPKHCMDGKGNCHVCLGLYRCLSLSLSFLFTLHHTEQKPTHSFALGTSSPETLLCFVLAAWKLHLQHCLIPVSNLIQTAVHPSSSAHVIFNSFYPRQTLRKFHYLDGCHVQLCFLSLTQCTILVQSKAYYTLLYSL